MAMGTRIPIETFLALDNIREAHVFDASQEKWARATGHPLTQTRIAELRSIHKVMIDEDLNQRGAERRLGRTCSMEKVFQLKKGLKSIIGGKTVNARLLEEAQKETDLQKRGTMMFLALEDVVILRDVVNYMEKKLKAKARQEKTSAE